MARTFTTIYAYSGFFQPVDNGKVNLSQAGSAVPVKFSLGGDQGLAILAAGYPKSSPQSCSTAQPTDPVEETVTAGQSSLAYDPLAQQYVYVWKTEKAWAGTCRQLQVKLADDTVHVASFQFKK